MPKTRSSVIQTQEQYLKLKRHHNPQNSSDAVSESQEPCFRITTSVEYEYNR